MPKQWAFCRSLMHSESKRDVASSANIVYIQYERFLQLGSSIVGAINSSVAATVETIRVCIVWKRALCIMVEEHE